MNKIHTKLLSGLLSLSMLVSLSIPVFAYNSTGSNSDLDNLIGEDTVQDATTEYHDPISSGQSSAQTDVYVTRSSTFAVLVPKTIILSGDTGIGSYVVGAKGDVLPEDAIQIEPDSYELTLYKKDDASKTVDAVITQDATSVSGAQVEAANGAYATMEGSIRADLKAGSWSTKMQFNIRLVEDGEAVEPEEPIVYQNFILTQTNRAKIGYTNETTDLVIPETFYDEEDGVWYKVIAIGERTFNGCTSLKSVIIPDSVTVISQNAFSGCTSLTSATIPDSVTSISANTFYDCTSLESVTIPDSVTLIGEHAFYGCTSLESIIIPDSVTSIGEGAFLGCKSLKSVTIPDSITSIGANTFYDCISLESVTIPNSVTSIGDLAFAGCTNLKLVNIPDSVTSIGASAFYACTSLTELRVPNSVTKIGDIAFYDVSKVIYNGLATGSPWGAKAIAAA